jgi:hypothetical protein
MIEMRRVTTAYVATEDRLRLTGEASDGQPIVLWITQRLLNRLLPQLLRWLEQHASPKAAGGSALMRSEAMQSFAQQAARVKLAPQAPVNAAAASRSWLAVSAGVSAGPKGVRLTFKGLDAGGEQADTASMTLQVQPLRQWLGIVYNQYQKSEWPLTVWPDWVRESAVKEARPDVMLH